MFKLLTIVFLTVLSVSSIAEEKYDFAVDKSLLCISKQEMLDRMSRNYWVPVIRTKQESGFTTYIYFKEDDTKPGAVNNIIIFEIDPTETSACVLTMGKEGTIEFNGSFWNEFYLTPMLNKSNGVNV
jgi:hypothetical protein|tara:strand:+ start:171 stop:551 length:381 start_codon:yes stop_codon:yes gene_type:complete